MNQPHKITLLYVDDEPINLELFQITFRRSFNILTAESGEEGLAILKNNSEINVIISDMKMPNMSGIEFIQEASKIYRSTIYFILSGYSITNEIKQLISNGLIKNYFQKPFNRDEIIASITESTDNKNIT